MTTRQTIRQDPANPQPHMPTGYDTSETTPTTDYFLPSCGIKDVDESVFNLFNEELGYTPREIQGKQSFLQLNKPFVVFASGERFSTVKRLRPMKDNNGAIILPAIAIRRTGIEQTDQDITGRGINQMTGEITVRRKLDVKDRNYQKFLNKYLLQNVNDTSTRQEKQQPSPSVQQGILLEPQQYNNMVEVITIPAPQFYTANYEVVFWTIHQTHMNYMLETLFANFLPQSRGFRLTTEKGYWFVADVDETFSNDSNDEDFTEDKRLVRYSFTMKVKAYILATDAPGNSVPFRRYISAPQISFNIYEGNDVQRKTDLDRLENKFALTPTDGDVDSQTTTTLEKYKIAKEIVNPITGEKEIKYVTISDSPKRQSETVYSAPDGISLDSFILSKNKEHFRQ